MRSPLTMLAFTASMIVFGPWLCTIVQRASVDLLRQDPLYSKLRFSIG